MPRFHLLNLRPGVWFCTVGWTSSERAGCPLCRDAVALVERLKGDSDHLVVHDMGSPQVVTEAYRLGIRSVPTILIDGHVVGSAGGVDEAGLRAALGLPLE